MGVTYSISAGEHFPQSLMTDLIKRRKPHAVGSAKKDVDAADNRQYGWLSAKYEDLAHYVNEMRVRLYVEALAAVGETETVKHVPGIHSHNAQEWCQTMLEIWDNQNDKLTDAEWYKCVEDNFKTLVADEKIAEEIESLRRKAILSGRMDPTEDDLVWLSQEREQHLIAVSPYDKALQKLEHGRR